MYDALKAAFLFFGFAKPLTWCRNAMNTFPVSCVDPQSIFFCRVTFGCTIYSSILQRMLTITLGMPASMKGNTIGLTGVYDDDQDNDFTWPNATGYISVNSSESEIFDWASLCKFQ